MNKYINQKKKNPTEEAVRSYFQSIGYKTIHKGWPDFCFFRFLPNQKVEAIFVEVKRSNQTTIKPHQNTIKKIFKRLGIDVKVCFGLNPDGTPNFQDIEGRRIQKRLQDAETYFRKRIPGFKGIITY